MEDHTHTAVSGPKKGVENPVFLDHRRFISQKKLELPPRAHHALHRKLRYPLRLTEGEHCQQPYRGVQKKRVHPDTLLKDAAEHYLAWLEGQVSVQRRHSNTLASRRYGLSFLGLTSQEHEDAERRTLADEPVGYLRRSAIIDWLSGLSNVVGQKGWRLESIEFTALRSLQALLKWCADRDACIPGLALGIVHEYKPRPQTSLSWEELDDLRELLDQAETNASGIQRVLVQLLKIVAADGARMYEIRCARVHQFDAHKGVLRWANGKNPNAPRVIVLSPESQEIIREHIFGKAPTEFIFVNPATRRPPTHQAINKRLRIIASQSTVLRDPDALSTHGFRHTWATLAHEGREDDEFDGCSVEDIADGLGHASTMTTKKHYLHNAVKPGARRVNQYMNRGRRLH